MSWQCMKAGGEMMAVATVVAVVVGCVCCARSSSSSTTTTTATQQPNLLHNRRVEFGVVGVLEGRRSPGVATAMMMLVKTAFVAALLLPLASPKAPVDPAPGP